MPTWLLFFKLLPQFVRLTQWADKQIKEGRTLMEIKDTFQKIEDAHSEKDADKSSKMLANMMFMNDINIIHISNQ